MLWNWSDYNGQTQFQEGVSQVLAITWEEDPRVQVANLTSGERSSNKRNKYNLHEKVGTKQELWNGALL